MFDRTIPQIIEACRGTVISGDPGLFRDLRITRVSTDSRDVGPDALFVPLAGERVDAHRFIPQALQKAFVSLSSREVPGCPEDRVVILVPDTLQALQDLAAAERDRIRIPVIGVTGSVGKTTCRQMIAAALSAEKRVYATAGNHNSQIGVPATVFDFDEDAEIAVLEMGMSMPGEMRRIAAVVRPESAVFTNIGISHIENLGSRENILKEKMHICDYIPEGGTVFLNHDNDLLRGCVLRKGLKAYDYGSDPGCDCHSLDVDLSRGCPDFTASVSGERVRVSLQVYGAHQVGNALAALSVAKHYGIGLEGAAEKLASFTGYRHRQQILRAGGITIIDDTYNAAVDSMKAAIDILAGFPGTHRRIAVLADMKELGEQADGAHDEVGAWLASKGSVDLLFTYGDKAERIGRAAGGVPQRHFTDRVQLEESLDGTLREGDLVLLKGSNSMNLGEIADRLAAAPGSLGE